MLMSSDSMQACVAHTTPGWSWYNGMYTWQMRLNDKKPELILSQS